MVCVDDFVFCPLTCSATAANGLRIPYLRLHVIVGFACEVFLQHCYTIIEERVVNKEHRDHDQDTKNDSPKSFLACRCFGVWRCENSHEAMLAEDDVSG